jgi:predicted acyl esterase
MRVTRRGVLTIGLAVVVTIGTAVGRAQAPVPPVAGTPSPTGADLVRATYTKYEYLVPMRDGARLFTAVLVPKDASRAYPFLLTRTPYSVAPYGVDRYPPSLGSEPLQKEGFIFVRQDAPTCRTTTVAWA